MGDGGKWLEAHHDSKADLCVPQSCLTFGNVTGDGDHKLIVADLKMGAGERSRLKTYRGTTLHSDQPLPDAASCVVAFYTDDHEPRIPAVAVACGPTVLVFKNNRPYFKFAVPSLPINAFEQDLWNKTSSREIDCAELLASLRSVPYPELTARSQRLLGLAPDQTSDFVAKCGLGQLTRPATVCCGATLNRSSLNRDSVACLVVATETGHVYILDPNGFGVLHEANVAGAPCKLACSGTLDVEFRCVVGCRDGRVHLLRRGWLEARLLCLLGAPIVDMAMLDDASIVVATRDATLHCYSKKGRRLWHVGLTGRPTCLAHVPLGQLQTSLVAVALHGGAVQLYGLGGTHVDTIQGTGTVVAMRFGHLGREDNVLVTVGGALTFRILKRTANFVRDGLGGDETGAQPAPALPLPKRSRLFAEQAARERDNALAIHQTFQKDLIRLRLTACRAIVDVHNNVEQNTRSEGKFPLKLSAQVLGLGPKFTLTLSVENMSGDHAVGNLSVVFHARADRYLVATPFTELPLLPPGITYKVDTNVTEQLSDEAQTQPTPVRVFLLNDGQTLPILAACIEMPPTDPLGTI